MKRLTIILESIFLKSRGEISNHKIAFFLLFMNIITSASVSVYIPCLKQMAIDLQTTNEMMQMTIVIHLIGEFVGRVLCGPLIQSKGTKFVVIPALIMSTIGHMGCCLATNLPLFICMRFTQALGASVIYVVSLSIINSMFEGKEKAGVVGILELYQPVSWILSPFAGAILYEIGSWRLSFLALMLAQLIGLAFFSVVPEVKHHVTKFSAKKLIADYKFVLKNAYFVIYSLIPGLFAGGYMIFATSSPLIFSKFVGDNSTDIALFSAIPLLFYVLGTFAYRAIVKHYGIQVSKWLGTSIYAFFGCYIIYLVVSHSVDWTAPQLIGLMCIQCLGSAFLVPVSVFKAMQSASHMSASVGASAVVVFRNIIMSLCISLGVRFNGSVTTIMACVFMTVGGILTLITTRRIIKVRRRRKNETANV